ncbi:MAG: hypothetical protein JXR91_17555 [Deltaproteobacteria bacterium]|nr:hypothetical protein [Deltaproteobacteria bacterium]
MKKSLYIFFFVSLILSGCSKELAFEYDTSNDSSTDTDLFDTESNRPNDTSIDTNLKSSDSGADTIGDSQSDTSQYASTDTNIDTSSENIPNDTEITVPPHNISGIVVDNNDNPIENALVSLAKDPYIFDKTDENGSFLLAGATANILTAGALGYESRRDINKESADSVKIVLQTDSLLKTDVYHISFDHLRPGDHYSEEELKVDFPVGYGLGYYQDMDESKDRAFVDPFESRDKDGRSLRVKFPANQLKTANSGVDTRIPLSGTYKDNPFDGDELYLSYFIKFSDNFDFEKCGGKLPSLGGSLLGVRDKEWKGRIMWRAGGSIQFYMELPHDADGITDDADRFWGDKIFDGGDICTNRFTPYLNIGKWHQIELHYKLETPGLSDGLFEGWVDGDKGHKLVSSEVFGLYRRPGEGMDTLTINAILISAFLGGSTVEYEHSDDVYAWFDEFRVSKTRIGTY